MNQTATVSLIALLLAGCASPGEPGRVSRLLAFLDPSTGTTYHLPVRCTFCGSGAAVASVEETRASVAAVTDRSLLQLGEPVEGALRGSVTVAAAAPARYLPVARTETVTASAPVVAPEVTAAQLAPLPEPRLKIDMEFTSAKRLVVFGLGRAGLGPVGKAAVAELVPWAKQAEKVYLRGGADSSGNARRNEELALARAASAKSAFVAAGVDEAKLIASYCASCYVTDNDTVEGRRLNRRVEVELVLQQKLAARMPKPVHSTYFPLLPRWDEKRN